MGLENDVACSQTQFLKRCDINLYKLTSFQRNANDDPFSFLDLILTKVVSVDKKTAELFVRQKHYSRRSSIFWCGFGLEEDGMITGVVVYGQPSPPIQRSAFKDRDFRLYELSRLVIQSKTKNAASILIGRSLQMLEPQPCAVISYADSEWSHCGIVYQATNWTYTGATVSHDHAYLIDGKRVHPITLRDTHGITKPKEWAKINGIETIKPMPKHRYFYFVGDKKQKKAMRDQLTYPVIAEYPKCDAKRYDDGPDLLVPSLDDVFRFKT